MRRKVAIAFFLLITIASEHRVDATGFRVGDVLVGFFAGSPRLQQYRPDGALVQSFDGTGSVWLGASVFSNRSVITTRRLPAPGINIFYPDGHEYTFSIDAEVLPGDVSVFADGTLAISDQLGRVVFYSQLGAFLGEITDASLENTTPFGSAIGPDDTLWIAARRHPVSRTSPTELVKFSRNGQFLGSITLPFQSRDIGIDNVDGSLWLPSHDGMLHHFASDGSEMASFMTEATPPFLEGVAVARDRSLYVTSSFSDSVYHYSRSGELLDSFRFASTGRPSFMSIVLVPEPATFLSLGMAMVSFGLSIRRRQTNKLPRKPVSVQHVRRLRSG